MRAQCNLCNTAPLSADETLKVFDLSNIGEIAFEGTCGELENSYNADDAVCVYAKQQIHDCCTLSQVKSPNTQATSFPTTTPSIYPSSFPTTTFFPTTFIQPSSVPTTTSIPSSVRSMLPTMLPTVLPSKSDECEILCNEGEVSHPSRKIKFGEYNEIITCEDLSNRNPLLPNVDLEARCLLVNLYRFACGCGKVSRDEPSCNLCVNDTLPVPSRMFSKLDTEHSCGAYQYYYKDVNDSKKCNEYQATVGLACGCRDPPRPACDVLQSCPDGREFDFDLEAENPFDKGQPTSKLKCREIFFELNSDGRCIEEFKSSTLKLCCSRSDSLSRYAWAPWKLIVLSSCLASLLLVS